MNEKTKFFDILKLLRPSHYIKNLLIFAPLLFSRELPGLESVLQVAYMFIPFCLVCSSIYIINDIKDREKDAAHPKKCKRPIASGKISVRVAVTLVCVLIFVSTAMCFASYFLDFFLLKAVIVLAFYFALNIAYSVGGAKNVPLVDVVILASGFLLRLFYGSLVSGIPISSWFYLTILAGAFFFALGKRRNEIIVVRGGVKTRDVLKGYTLGFLDKNMYLCATLAIAFYSLWCIDSVTVSQWGRGMLFTVPFILVIFMRYSMVLEGDSDGDPVNVVTGDRTLLFLCLLYVLSVVGIIVFHRCFI